MLQSLTTFNITQLFTFTYTVYMTLTFPGAKARPGRDADHSPPSSAEDVNE
jgi:hypothetical protein